MVNYGELSEVHDGKAMMEFRMLGMHQGSL